MKNSFLVLYSIISILFWAVPVISQDSSLPKIASENTSQIDVDTTEENLEEILEEVLEETLESEEMVFEFKKELNQIQAELQHEKYNSALFLLNNLEQQLQERQRDIIETYFPEEFEQYTSIKDPSLGQSDYTLGNNYGVLLSKQYKNMRGHTLDIYVIFSDPSIAEYINLIKNPMLIDGLENTKLVMIQKEFKALEKMSLEQQFVEQNLIVNEELLINIVSNGSNESDILERFSTQIDINGLITYLAPQL